MKIKNSRIHSAELYLAENYSRNQIFESSDGDAFGFYTYNEKPTGKNLILVRIGCMYVPVKFVTNLKSYIELKSHEHGKGGIYYPDARFYSTHPTFNAEGCCILKNLKPVFPKHDKGKTSLGELHAMQEQYALAMPATDIEAKSSSEKSEEMLKACKNLMKQARQLAGVCNDEDIDEIIEEHERNAKARDDAKSPLDQDDKMKQFEEDLEIAAEMIYKR